MAQVEQRTEEIEIENPGGDPDPVKVWYQADLPRGDYYDAWEAAAIAYKERYGDYGGLSIVALERELAKRIIKRWNLPRHVTNGGWEALERSIGDKISERLGIRDLINEMKDEGEAPEGMVKEVDDAKN